MMDFEQDIEIEIERLEFRGMELSAERAEGIRGLVERALGRLLVEDGERLSGLEEGDSSFLSASGAGLTGLDDDNRLARELAKSIVRSLGANDTGDYRG